MRKTAWIVAGIGGLGLLFATGPEPALACSEEGALRRTVTIENHDTSGFITLAGGDKVALASIDRESQRLPRLKGQSAILIVFGIDRHKSVLGDLVVDGTSLRRSLLTDGLARLRPGRAPDPCLTDLRALEREARRAGLGLWGQTQYGIINAADADQVRRSAGRFVVATGVVVHVGVRNKRVYLDFGREMRRSATAIVDRRQIEIQTGGPASALTGRVVEVRGVVEIGEPPRIEVESTGSLVIVSELENVRRTP